MPDYRWNNDSIVTDHIGEMRMCCMDINFLWHWLLAHIHTYEHINTDIYTHACTYACRNKCTHTYTSTYTFI